MNFLPVVGYEGSYEVSDCGVVRSIDRKVTGTDGTVYPFKGKVLVPTINCQTGYPQVSLWKENIGIHHHIHRLVMEAFVPNPMNHPVVNHLDSDRQNNSVSNLEWCSQGDNINHAIAAGRRTYPSRMTKDEFTEALQDVIAGESYGSLSLRTPYKVPFLSTKLRKLAKELGVEDLLDESLYKQKVERARVNGNKNK